MGVARLCSNSLRFGATKMPQMSFPNALTVTGKKYRYFLNLEKRKRNENAKSRTTCGSPLLLQAL
jgi:hypothetical protein